VARKRRTSAGSNSARNETAVWTPLKTNWSASVNKNRMTAPSSASPLRPPQDHVAVALVATAEGAKPVDIPRIKPNEIVAIGRAILLNANTSDLRLATNGVATSGEVD
jgi:hypothetical protein